MRFPVEDHQFLSFFPPYRSLEPLDHPSQFPKSPLPVRGGALFWNLRLGDWGTGFKAIRQRPPGVALFLLLPPAAELAGTEELLDLMENCRPHSILPFQKELDPEELVHILRRFPSNFAVEVTEYLVWRGIEVDLDTRQLIRKTLTFSGELRTVTALARSLYMSRRALGRRFMSRGLPVPSHWLHFARILRASLLLQKNDANLYSIACHLGYPDGFSLSNQMMRLTKLRPSLLRDCFGWEWIVEAWLHQEAVRGTISPLLCQSLFPEGVKSEKGLNPDHHLSSSLPSLRLNVAEEPLQHLREGLPKGTL
jgi:AraC-like DNA-binding protein